MKPDDITHEEWHAAHRAYFRRDGTMRDAVAAQNALRDQRVAAEAARAERERIARMVEQMGDAVCDFLPGGWDTDDHGSTRGHRLAAADCAAEAIAAALREESDAPDPEPCPKCVEGYVENNGSHPNAHSRRPCSSCGGTGHTPTKETPT